MNLRKIYAILTIDKRPIKYPHTSERNILGLTQKQQHCHSSHGCSLIPVKCSQAASNYHEEQENTRCVSATPPITESQVFVTSHWNGRERNGHNNQLLNNRLDRNHLWSSFISPLLLYNYHIFWEMNTWIVFMWLYSKTSM